LKIIVTGAAGFIGSTMVDRLLSLGEEVVGIDNLSTGRIQFLSEALKNPNFTLIQEDLLTSSNYSYCFSGADLVFHFAANADVRNGTLNTRKDIEQNIIVTHNVLEAMRSNGVKKIAFSSTGSVYGDAVKTPTAEDSSFPIQTSLYGTSKIACEGLLSSYCEGFEFQAWIFRFVSILGERYTHGHIYDFYQKLKCDPSFLSVLGNGKQKKSYLYVQDCIDAMLVALNKSNDRVNLFNLGVDGFCEVNDSINWICKHLGIKPSLKYSGGDRGWVGDNPFIYLDTSKMRNLGWLPKVSIQQGVLKTMKFLELNEWLFESEKSQ